MPLESEPLQQSAAMPPGYLVASLLLAFACWLFAVPALAACPGCCSHHDGISNRCASNGKILCNDGTASPSCSCSSCGVTGGPATPSCSLSASPPSIELGNSSQLSASCSPAASTFNWTNSGFGSTQASGTVRPTTTMTYSVRGTNSGGTGSLASATVVVTLPTCSGGATWNGSACACAAGQFLVDGQCFTPLPATRCGTERWAIKTGTDGMAAQVTTTTSVPTTIQTLAGIPRPGSLSATARSEPVELRTYGLDATLVSYQFNVDSDYILTINDAAGRTMLAAIPHPDCVGPSSPLRTAIAAARATINARLQVGTTAKTASMPVRLFGIGHFHSTSRTGAAVNWLAIHPALKIEFSPTTPITADPNYPPTPDTTRLYSWAEAAYPQLFPKPATTGTYEQYSYRYYAGTGTYLAISGGRVTLHNGKEWNLLDAGEIGSFLPMATAVGN